MISRSSYYEKKSRKTSKREKENEELKLEIRRIWELSHKRYGSPKIKEELKKEGKIICEKRVQKLMREEGMKSIVLRKYKPLMKKSEEVEGLKNELERDFESEKARGKIVGDITYIKTKDKGWCYLASYMDLFNREIIGWDFSEKMELEVVLNALGKIPEKDLKGSIIHTDRGSQYTSIDYRAKLKKLKSVASYSRKGNPYDNACIESFHSVLKKELIYPQELKSYEEMKLQLFEYIESWYNGKRIQKRLGYLSPKEYLLKIS